jgi:hypothetical protein
MEHDVAALFVRRLRLQTGDRFKDAFPKIRKSVKLMIPMSNITMNGMITSFPSKQTENQSGT